MPRSGSDYVYQSRILHPSIGFSITFGFFSITWVITAVLGGFAISYYALQPLLYHLAYLYNNESWINMAVYVSTPIVTFIITLVILVIAFLNSIAGMRWYRRVQNYILVPFIIISHIVLFALLISTSPEGFKQMFNFWGEKILNDPNFYNTVLTTAKSEGYITPKLDLYKTFAAFTLPGTWLGYIVFSAMGILGEVKGARSFKRLASAFIFAAFYTSILFTFLIILFHLIYTLSPLEVFESLPNVLIIRLSLYL